MSLQKPYCLRQTGKLEALLALPRCTCAPKMLHCKFVGDSALDVLHHVSNLCEFISDVFALVPYRVGADNPQDLTIRLRF